jgi:hypothetical protein
MDKNVCPYCGGDDLYPAEDENGDVVFKGRIWATFGEGAGQGYMICNTKGYKSLDHAKRACERHYKRQIKAIVAEARAIGVLKGE